MGSPGLFADCQNLIKREHESWKSYFTKWETFAKYEGEIAENNLLEMLDHKKSPKKKVKRQLSLTKPKTSKKNVRSSKKLVTKKNNFLNNKFDLKYTEQCQDSCSQDVENTENEQLETVLKSIFLQLLGENSSKLLIFTALSHTMPRTEATNSCRFFYDNQNSLLCNNSQLVARNFLYSDHKPLNTSASTVNNRSVLFSRTIMSPHQSLSRNLNPVECSIEIPLDQNKLRQTKRKFVNDFLNFSFQNNLNLHDFLIINSGNGQALQQRTQISLDKITSPALLSSYNSKPLRWDFAHKYLSNTCRRVNKEYFIKRSFSKMNIIQNGKGFGNIYSHKRTNSVSLSLENSNLVTPERKPPERKCFSENVFKRKRKHPSKLFFDDVVEDSESDDQNESIAPIIFCKNKKPIITKVEESDFDDCESIFDKVKKL